MCTSNFTLQLVCQLIILFISLWGTEINNVMLILKLQGT
jgi:hypothetical protein